jgi:Holliday junction DNA helicase RuvB
LRDRFGFTAHMDFYETADLERIVERAAGLIGIEADPDAIRIIASRSRGTPRIANRLLRRVRDYAQIHGDSRVDVESTEAALSLFEVDAIGLDRLDRAVLRALVGSFGGGPVGLSTLAVAVGEEAETVETVCEPFLLRSGFLARTPRGRVATARAYSHLGMAIPAGSDQLTLTDPTDVTPGR